MLYFILSQVPLVYLTIIKSKKSIHMLQQNYYDESNRYLLWIKANLKKVFLSFDLVLFLIVIGFILNDFTKVESVVDKNVNKKFEYNYFFYLEH